MEVDDIRVSAEAENVGGQQVGSPRITLHLHHVPSGLRMTIGPLGYNSKLSQHRAVALARTLLMMAVEDFV